MLAEPLEQIVRGLRRSAEAGFLADSGDAELLHRFLTERDGAAFEAIVRRHGSLVLAACCKVLSEGADVEDAFQATFLVLLRDARKIRKRPSVGPWLFGVAHRLAARVRADAARRRKNERKPVRRSIETTADLPWREACIALHEELDALPDRLRLPLLLCYLEGKSRDEAAKELGCSLNTVKKRLELGRGRLRGRLARRGLALSAGLLAAVADSAAANGLPSRLLQITLRAATTGDYSPAVAALLRGVSATMFPSPLKLTAGVILAAGLLVGAAGLRTAAPAHATPAEPPVEKAADFAKAQTGGPAVEPAEVVVSVRVLGPDGKPLAGAKVSAGAIWATTGDDGRFKITLLRPGANNPTNIVATAPGFGPDWAVVKNSDAELDLTFKLTKDDVPFIGRIASLENQPLKGVTVEVVRLGKPAEGDLTAWVTKNVEMRKEHYWLNEIGLVTVPGGQALAQSKTTTDAAGKFTLTGLGGERVLTVKVYGPSVETKFFWVVTRPDGPKDGYITTRDQNHGLYPPDVTVLLGPSRPLVGTVRDATTGQPVAGVVVSEVNSHVPKAITDANGKYRLEGVPKKQHYGLNVAGRKGLPYFDQSHLGLTDTAGLGPLETDLTVNRGLELTGRIIDKAGRPVRAEVHYYEARDNPNVRPNMFLIITSDGWKTKADGTFYLTVWPGNGVIDVRAGDRDRYIAVDVNKVLTEMGIRSRPVGPVNAMLPVDADASKPASLNVTVTLDEATPRKGSIVGPDGQPLTGVMVAGLKSGGPIRPLTSAEFTISGMNPQSRRLLLFLHDDKKLGAVQTVTGSANDPITVQLQPLGTITGEVRTTDKKPWAGLTVTAVPNAASASRFDNLMSEVFTCQGVSGMINAPSFKLTKRAAKTEADGRFHLEGLLPELEYTVYISDGDLAKQNTLVTSREKITVSSGKTHDLGVLRDERK